MRALAALVLHEINERKALLAAAAVASLLPLLAPLLPSTGSNPAEDIREAVMWVMVLGLVPLFALLLGVSFIGRDLAEHRLGFYYAQPISGATLWFGKLTAIVLLVWAVEALVMLPTLLLASDPLRILVLSDVLDPSDPTWLAPALFLGAGLAIVLVAHAVGIVWRGRSAWLVVDAVALLLVVCLAWSAVRPFVLAVAVANIEASSTWAVGWLLLGLLAAGAAQVAEGRVDPRLSHRVLSTTLWTVLLVAVSTLFVWSLWVRTATVDDLDDVSVDAIGPGDWIAVSGRSTGRLDFRPRFLVNVVDERALSIGPATSWSRIEVWMSDDGTTAVWPQIDGPLSWTIMSADLTSDEPIPRTVNVSLDETWRDLAISSDGSRVAVLEGRTLAVYQGCPAEQLTAVRIEEPLHPQDLRFDDSDAVRVLATSYDRNFGDDLRWWLLWFDIGDRRLTEKVEIDTAWWWEGRSRDGEANHQFALVDEGDRRHLAIRDPGTGDIVRDLEVRSYWGVRMLGEGRFLVIRTREGDCAADIFGPAGELVGSIELPKADAIFDGPMIDPDRLLVGLIDSEGEPPNRRAGYRTLVIDVADRSHRELSRRHIPVLGRWGVSSSSGSWAFNALATRLLYGDDGALYMWNSDADEIKKVLPKTG